MFVVKLTNNRQFAVVCPLIDHGITPSHDQNMLWTHSGGSSDYDPRSHGFLPTKRNKESPIVDLCHDNPSGVETRLIMRADFKMAGCLLPLIFEEIVAVYEVSVEGDVSTF